MSTGGARNTGTVLTGITGNDSVVVVSLEGGEQGRWWYGEPQALETCVLGLPVLETLPPILFFYFLFLTGVLVNII